MEEKGVRDWLLMMPELVTTIPQFHTNWRLGRVTREYVVCLHYACKNPTTRRRVRVNVEAEVAKWRDCIIGLATSHTVAENDQYDYQLDDLFEAILAAPVAQIRQFYRRLTEVLKDDPRCPYLVWRSFELWCKGILEPAPDQEAIQLKEEMAQYIANAVEQEVQPDIGEAIMNALRWRPPEQLAEVKQALDEGERPRVRGRESCLFLEVGEHKVML